jgi:hypothetical protein
MHQLNELNELNELVDESAGGAGNDDLRPRPQIMAVYQRLHQQQTLRLTHPEGCALPDVYAAGQTAALAWALGEVELAPLSRARGADVSVSATLDEERHVADEMLCGRMQMSRWGRNYVVGVALALLWMREQTDSEL